ncbi:MAG: hypothetical protein ABJM82_16880 [Shimia thalassica]
MSRNAGGQLAGPKRVGCLGDVAGSRFPLSERWAGGHAVSSTVA